MEEWPVVGRDDLVASALDRLAPGGAGVLLLGEAGVGKTRLARELARTLEASGDVVARVAGDDSVAGIPLGGLGHLLPADVARRSMVDGRVEPGSMYHLARSELAALADGGRLIVVADDADRLDELSLALLGQLARGDEITLLATVRGTTTPAGTLERLVSDGVLAVLPVEPLDGEAIRELLRRTLGPVGEGMVATRLAEVSRGVPLYVRELVESSIAAGTLDLAEGRWHLAGPLQPSAHLIDLVEDRLRHLEAHERRVLEAIALVGKLSLGIAEGIAPAQVLESLEARALIDLEASRRRQLVGLAHPLHGEVLRSQLPALRARNLRQSIADIVEGFGARRRVDRHGIAILRLDAGLDVDPDSLVEAARLSMAAHDQVSAERMARIAWSRTRAPEAGVVLLAVLHRLTRSEELEALARELWVTQLTAPQLVTVARLRAINLLLGLSEATAPQVVEEALAKLEPSPERERLRAHHAEMLSHLGWPRRALDAADGVEVGDTPSVQVELAAAKAMASSMVGRPDDALRAADEGLEVIDADRSGEHDRRSLLTINRVIALTFLGRPREAKAFVDVARSSAQERGARGAAVWFAHWSSWVSLYLGDVATVLDHGAEFASWSRQQGNFANERWSVALLARAHLLRGDRDAARPWVERAVELEYGGKGLFHPDIDRAVVWLAMADGRVDDALERLWESVEASRERGRVTFEALSLHDLVRMGRAGDAAPRLVELAAEATSPLVRSLATLADSVVRADGTTAEGAVDRLEDMGFTWHAAEAASLWGQLLDEQGRARSATAARQRADRLSAEVGGIHTPPMRRTETIALTPRELETALLAAEGLASKEIAARLSVSARTVDTHLARVYVKLGVSGRSELAEALDAR